MKVEVWSDIVCPFCYIGKRNYESALAQFADRDDIEVIWKSFQLDPAAPAGNTTQSGSEYLAARKGWSPEQTRQIEASVTETAKRAGLVYHLDQAKVANTFQAHRIIQYAKTKGLGNEAEEQFFKAHFTDSLSLNDRQELLAVGRLAGLTDEEVKDALTDKKYEDAVNADFREARLLGISGVPFFVFNRKYAVSGAQPPEAFLQTLGKSFTEWRKENPSHTFETVQGQACTPDGNCG